MYRCAHDYELETVGGAYLTGAYVCRKCSFRKGMSQSQFHEHSLYPAHYQAQVNNEPTIKERASMTLARYSERLKQQLTELTSEELSPTLSEDEHNEILTEVIEEALLDMLRACEGVAVDCGLSDGKAVAEHMELQLCRRTRDNVSSVLLNPPNR